MASSRLTCAIVFCALGVILCSLAAGGYARADAGKYDWVLRKLKIADIEMGQHRDDVAAAIPDLTFDLPYNEDPSTPDIAAMLWHPAQMERYEEGVDVKTWGLFLYFGRSNGLLYRVLADFPPPGIQTNTQLIDLVLKKLGPPEKTRSTEDVVNPSVSHQEFLWGNEGLDFSLPLFDKKFPYVYIKLLSDRTSGQKIITDLEYTATEFVGSSR